MTSKVSVCFVIFVVMLGASRVSAQNDAPGKEHYDARCLSCHKDTPYGKGQPKAQSLDAVRATAKLWASIAPGTPWNQQQMDDVVRYLNQNFYHY
jgi:mono/diheme cytochrome c family protein